MRTTFLNQSKGKKWEYKLVVSGSGGSKAAGEVPGEI